MNAFEMSDPLEEPGFPTLSTTPRSIRNMENIIAMIDQTKDGALNSPTSQSPPQSPHSPPSPREPLGSPKRSKSMTGRDVWHLGRGTGGPRSYGSFSKVTKDKWDSSKPGGETVWDHILKSEKAKEGRSM